MGPQRSERLGCYKVIPEPLLVSCLARMHCDQGHPASGIRHIQVKHTQVEKVNSISRCGRYDIVLLIHHTHDACIQAGMIIIN